MKQCIRYIVFAAVCLLAGCGGKTGPDSGSQAIVDDYAEIILQRDADSADYDSALSAVGNYLEKKDSETLKAAESLLRDTIDRMKKAAEKTEPYQMDDDFEELLKKHNIEPEEYVMNADERSQNLQHYVESLEVLNEYLSYEEEDSLTRDALAKEYEMVVKIQEVFRRYDYCGINYWFAGWEEEETAYVREQVHDKLKSFSAVEEVWQDDRDAVEQRMEIYLNEVEELSGEWADYIGEYQDELYQLQKDSE